MVESWRCVALVGMVVRGVAHHGLANPWDAVRCLLACLRSVFCRVVFSAAVVLAVLWLACASWVQLRSSPRRRSRMLSLLSSGLVLRFVVAGRSEVAVIML